MRTKIYLVFLLASLLVACHVPRYLPTEEYLPHYQNIGLSEFGAVISINFKDRSQIDGELIAVKGKYLIVEVKQHNNRKIQPACNVYDSNEIASFSLRYARPKNYNYVGFFPLVSISHGYFGLFTLPINLVTAPSIINSANQSYLINGFKFSSQELSKFARFPQGLPEQLYGWCDVNLGEFINEEKNEGISEIPIIDSFTFVKLNDTIGYVIDSLENLYCKCIPYVSKDEFRYAVLVTNEQNFKTLKIKLKDHKDFRDVNMTVNSLQVLYDLASETPEGISFIGNINEEIILKMIAGDSTLYKKINFKELY